MATERTTSNRRMGAGRQQALDARWNLQVNRVLREAADLREQRERDRAGEDDRTARREAAALLELIRAHDRTRAGAVPPIGPRAAVGDRRG